MAEQRADDLELVRHAGQYERVLQAYLANITFCDALVGRLLDALDASPPRRTRSSSSGPTTAGISARSSTCTNSRCGTDPRDCR